MSYAPTFDGNQKDIVNALKNEIETSPTNMVYETEIPINDSERTVKFITKVNPEYASSYTTLANTDGLFKKSDGVVRCISSENYDLLKSIMSRTVVSRENMFTLFNGVVTPMTAEELFKAGNAIENIQTRGLEENTELLPVKSQYEIEKEFLNSLPGEDTRVTLLKNLEDRYRIYRTYRKEVYAENSTVTWPDIISKYNLKETYPSLKYNEDINFFTAAEAKAHNKEVLESMALTAKFRKELEDGKSPAEAMELAREAEEEEEEQDILEYAFFVESFNNTREVAMVPEGVLDELSDLVLDIKDESYNLDPSKKYFKYDIDEIVNFIAYLENSFDASVYKINYDVLYPEYEGEEVNPTRTTHGTVGKTEKIITDMIMLESENTFNTMKGKIVYTVVLEEFQVVNLEEVVINRSDLIRLICGFNITTKFVEDIMSNVDDGVQNYITKMDVLYSELNESYLKVSEELNIINNSINDGENSVDKISKKYLDLVIKHTHQTYQFNEVIEALGICNGIIASSMELITREKRFEKLLPMRNLVRTYAKELKSRDLYAELVAQCEKHGVFEIQHNDQDPFNEQAESRSKKELEK